MAAPITIEKVRELVTELEAALANLDAAHQSIAASHVSMAIDHLRHSAGIDDNEAQSGNSTI
ncbi:hypothetical protein [Novosphingobium lindaniclasticum]